MTKPLNDAALTDELLMGLYRVGKKIGKGGSAWVYHGTKQDETPIAIKVLLSIYSEDLPLQQRFLREAQLQYRLHHPNIVQVFDLIEDRGITGFVMEWCDGGDLRQWSQGKTFTLDDLTELYLPILDAVDYAHSEEIVHRDLKPQNILLCHSPKGTIPKVTDFGIAKLHYDEAMTQTGSTLGTLHYMAPEQLEDSKHVDKQADIYSLGVILYLLFTGRLPFPDKSPALAYKILTEEAPPPTEAPLAIQPVITKCLQKDPKQRFSDCKALKAALEAALTNTASVLQPALQHRGQPLPTARTQVSFTSSQQALEATSPPSSSKLWIGISSGLFALLVVALVLLFQSRQVNRTQQPNPPQKAEKTSPKKSTGLLATAKRQVATPKGLPEKKAPTQNTLAAPAPKRKQSSKKADKKPPKKRKKAISKRTRRKRKRWRKRRRYRRKRKSYSRRRKSVRRKMPFWTAPFSIPSRKHSIIVSTHEILNMARYLYYFTKKPKHNWKKEGRRLIKLACKLRNGEACVRSGLMYWNKDVNKMQKYFDMGCRYKSAEGCIRLGILHVGQGIAHRLKDLKLACHLFLRGCREKHFWGCGLFRRHNCGQIPFRQPRGNASKLPAHTKKRIHRIRVTSGAIGCLARYYHSETRKKKRAEQLSDRGCREHDGLSCFINAGMQYSKGRKRDYYMLMKHACLYKLPRACYNVGYYHRKGIPGHMPKSKHLECLAFLRHCKITGRYCSVAKRLGCLKKEK